MHNNKQKTLKSIGTIIETKRKKAGLSQTELAKQIGVTKSTISKYEHGKIDMPASVLPAISESCNFKLSDYIETEEKAHIATEITRKAYENTYKFDNELSISENVPSIVKDDSVTYGFDIEDEMKDYFIRHEENADLVIALQDYILSPDIDIKNSALDLCINVIPHENDNKLYQRVAAYFEILQKK